MAVPPLAGLPLGDVGTPLAPLPHAAAPSSITAGSECSTIRLVQSSKCGDSPTNRIALVRIRCLAVYQYYRSAGPS